MTEVNPTIEEIHCESVRSSYLRRRPGVNLSYDMGGAAKVGVDGLFISAATAAAAAVAVATIVATVVA